ncbi:peptide chain release factor family protein [Actomonas aquatica]|uniref:Peptide chain release factor-like protein n=1 Tax=Actomonas aquatica TaxID=2866162 RepID=A0ABZ1CBF6_9BACT|nr:peptide chain release factor-like protein [Opitutus sp. WL0086]WRQ88786.1 peptide chain release factor-like protein [Opitutus sp. WL0086]
MDLPPQIEERLQHLGVEAHEVEERFVRGAGPGGQKINKTASTVVLRHGDSGVEVRRQTERSQAVNRRLAWLALCEKLEERRNAARAAVLAAREKEKRRKRGKSAATKRRQVESKRRKSVVKQRRGRVTDE